MIIPESVETIGNYAFQKSKIGGTVHLPNLTGIVPLQAFESTNIVGISSLGSITKISDETRTDRGPFRNCLLLERVVLPQTLTYIGGGSFVGCTALKEVVWSEALQYIYGSAFYNAPIEGTLSLPNLLSISEGAFVGSHISRVENLGQITSLGGSNSYNSFGVFWQNKKLEFFRIPATVTSIGGYALRECDVLETLVCERTTPPSLGANAFAGSKIASGNGYIYVPDASVTAYREASGWSAYADRIYPMSVYDEGLGNQIVFADPAVEAICLANFDYNSNGYISKAEAASVTNLGTVFKDNTEITSFNELKYFTGITSLGDVYFSGCTSLQYLTVPASITYLGWKSFERCSALKELVLLREDAIIPAKSNTL
jgi:hypothetical protein